MSINNSMITTWEDGVDLMRIFRAWRKHIWLFILAALLGGIVVFGLAKVLIAPSYQSGFAAYINNKSGASDEIVSSSDVSVSQSMANTYAEMISRRFILEEAAKRIQKDYSYKEMQQYVSTNTVSSMEIVEVTVTMKDPAAAMELAEAIADVAQLRIENIVSGSSMQIFEEPTMPTEIYSPDYTRLAAIGAVLGLILAAAAIALRELFDDRILTNEGLKERYGISELGWIPNIEEASKAHHHYRRNLSKGTRH